MNTEENNPSALFIYLSLHGTTKKAIDTLAASLEEFGITTDAYNLSEFENDSDFEKLNKIMPEYQLIILGSPTYFHHAPPMFEEFVRNMPDATYDQSVTLLATFGGVSSGIILYDLAKIVYQKKYSLIAGIQVLTEHSLTFQESTPFCAGHPDENDLTVIKDFGEEISIRIKNKTRRRYSPTAFRDKAYLSNFIDKYINKLKNFTWAMPNVKVNNELCTACGLCVRNCPTNNITLNDVATHGKNCTYCYSCMRNCPNGSTNAYLKPAKPLVKWLANRFVKYEDQITKQIV